MIDTQAIRNKILDLAIRGQLTEQMPEDGTGEELYRQIRDEKDQLIKERKLKKEKSLPPINDEEVPLANVSDDDADTDAAEDEEDTSGAVDPSAVDAPEGTAHGRISRTMLIGICAAGIAAALAVIIALLRSRKKGLSDDDDDEDEE